MQTTTHPLRSSYKVYDLASYRLLHALPAAGVRDVKMSGQLLVAVGDAAPAPVAPGATRRRPDGGGAPRSLASAALVASSGGSGDGGDADGAAAAAWVQPLAVYSAENGQLLARHALPLPGAAGNGGGGGAPAELEALELFGDRLLARQPGAPLRIYDVSAFESVRERGRQRLLSRQSPPPDPPTLTKSPPTDPPARAYPPPPTHTGAHARARRRGARAARRRRRRGARAPAGAARVPRGQRAPRGGV